MSDVIVGLSSMATRLLVADLAEEIGRRHHIAVSFTSGGGVEVARQVREGARADLLVLGDATMGALESEGLVVPGTLRPLFVSHSVAAVPDDSPAHSLTDEAELRELLVGASRIAYSTGPSGAGLLDLIDRWGLTETLRGRLVQAPPGVPVGSLLGNGEADLGIQQFSELMDVEGIRILGPLPGEAAVSTTFTGGVLSVSTQPQLAGSVLALLGSPDVAPLVESRGMSPAFVS